MPRMSGEDRITHMLAAVREGSPGAMDALFAVLYDELRVLAHRQLAGGAGTLGTTAVVHEVYLKLLGSSSVAAQDRGHFFALAARVMRQILVDHARARKAGKRGGGAAHVPFDEAMAGLASGEASAETILGLDAALARLQELDPRLGRLVELRFFVGLEVEECAELLGVTARTLRRDWRKARAFLYAALAGADGHADA